MIEWRKKEGLMQDNQASIPDRVKTLEIKIDGNGGSGLLKRMDNVEKDLKYQDERIDHLELRKVDVVSCEKFKDRTDKSWDVYEKRIEKMIIDTIHNQEKKWVKYAGPILTGLAAFLLAIKELPW